MRLRIRLSESESESESEIEIEIEIEIKIETEIEIALCVLIDEEHADANEKSRALILPGHLAPLWSPRDCAGCRPRGVVRRAFASHNGSCGLLWELHEPGRGVAFLPSSETWRHRVGGGWAPLLRAP